MGAIQHMRAVSYSRRRARDANSAQLKDAILNLLVDQRSGGIERLIDRFVEEGLGDVINSWISPLENQPVSDTQIRQVLRKEVLREIAWQACLSQREASSKIAGLLPELVDRLTPTGRVPPGGELQRRIRRVKNVSMS
jgi:uncharacterized protein YidB (DUF937 family)